MENDLIYWRHPTIPGIKVEEVSGGEGYQRGVWREMAYQVYCENGRDNYREIGHFPSGAPFLFNDPSRISITHCDGLLAVATLPPTPEADLAHFSSRAALGIDAERADRRQVIRIRERFLSDDELKAIPADDVAGNVLAWTVKEAAYKAALLPGIDFRKQIAIERMPRLAPPTTVYDPADFGIKAPAGMGHPTLPKEFFGHVRVTPYECCTDSKASPLPEFIDLEIYSYQSDDCIVTLAYSRQSAKFGKSI